MESGNSYQIRSATQVEERSIRRLIHAVNINPLNLHWEHFLVAVDGQGQILGCGQVKSHQDGTRELASIAVWPQYRHQGVARAIVRSLLAENLPPLYLTCVNSMRTFYEPFGFRIVEPFDLPPYFRRIHRIFSVLLRINPGMEKLLVMLKEA